MPESVTEKDLMSFAEAMTELAEKHGLVVVATDYGTMMVDSLEAARREEVDVGGWADPPSRGRYRVGRTRIGGEPTLEWAWDRPTSRREESA